MGVLRTGAGDTPVPSIGKPSSSAVADDSGIASDDLVSAGLKTGSRYNKIVDSSGRTKRLLRALWLVGIFIVVVASLLPADSLPMRALDRLHINDKLEHFAAYAVLAFLPAVHERKWFIVAAAVGAVALGIALEFGQLFSGWRDFEVGDMIADAVGVCFGLASGIPLRSTETARTVLFGE